uniref:p12 protein n=3 Tax=Cystovirus phi6 TaxID=10879 RepID=D7R9T3_9VIRU|nr:P12 protein [Cystovirus phi6]
MAIGLLKYLTPAVKVQMAARALGLSSAEVAAIDSSLGRVSAMPAVAMVLGGKPLSLATIASVVSDANPSATVGALMPAVQGMVSTDEGSGALAQTVVGFMESDPNSEILVSLLHKLSNLPIVGFGDTQYADSADFLAKGVFPMFRKQPEEVQAAPFTCRQCDHVDHISDVPKTSTFVHRCTSCGFVQMVHRKDVP